MFSGIDDAMKALVSEVYDVAPKKTDFLNFMKEAPSVFYWCPYVVELQHQGFVKGVEFAKPELEFWAVPVFSAAGSIMVHYSNPQALEDAIRETLKEYRQRKTVPTPAKVQTKMLALRLRRVQIEILNITKQNELYIKNFNGPVNPGRYGSPIAEMPDLEHCSFEEYKSWVRVAAKHEVCRYQKHLQEMDKILKKREDLTEEAFRQAASLTLTSEIMES